MRAKQLVTIAVVTTLLLGGMAALGGAAPVDQANENATDAHDGAAAESDAAANERAGNADGVGPSDGLPEQVPDHVGDIHDRIDAFSNGSIDHLGESLSELLGDDTPAGDADGESPDTGEEETDDADSDEPTDDDSDA
ncbi:MAG: hypothetical protein ACQET5_04560 [Halobacteriota archaeon]|uniref:hypothetical protein n=1 Tax=Natronomonas sp. TaxID=2184060 RepID=UPI003976A40A